MGKFLYSFPKGRCPYNEYTLEQVKADWEMAKEEGWLDDSPHNDSFDWYMFWAEQNGIITKRWVNGNGTGNNL